MIAKIAALTEENKQLKIQLGTLKFQKFARFNNCQSNTEPLRLNEDCWIYDKAADNHLESLICPVVISAKDLIDIINKSSKGYITSERGINYGI